MRSSSSSMRLEVTVFVGCLYRIFRTEIPTTNKSAASGPHWVFSSSRLSLEYRFLIEFSKWCVFTRLCQVKTHGTSVESERHD